jgi:hypothetical protein
MRFSNRWFHAPFAPPPATTMNSNPDPNPKFAVTSTGIDFIVMTLLVTSALQSGMRWEKL